MSEPQSQPVTAPHFAPAGSSQQQQQSSSSASGGGGGGLSAPTAAAVASRGTPATLNLDDIFGDCFFTPDGDAVFLSDQPAEMREGIVGSAEAVPSTMASRPAPGAAVGGVPPPQQPHPGAAPAPGAGVQAGVGGAAPAPGYVPVNYGGGIATTGLDRPNAASTVMGQPGATYAPAAAGGAPAAQQPPAQQAAPPKPVPFVQPPQQRHHLQYATPSMMAGGQPAPPAAQPAAGGSRGTSGGGGGKRKTSGGGGRSGERKMSDRQKVERRERNREHAKRSRIRKKFLLESLQQSVALLKEENEKLRDSIRTHLGDEAEELLKKENLAEAAANCAGGGLIAGSSGDANKVLDDPDFSFIKALQTAQQNFVVTDPSLPDNPIVYATQGFLNLTGYTLDQVLGRNCRFLQGPETDPKAVEKIRRAIEEGSDMSVCLLNYRVDGTTFWNQFFIAALRDAAGNITNYVGVQCKVSDQYAANVCKKQEEADAAREAAEAEEATAGGAAKSADDAAPVATAAAPVPAAPAPEPVPTPLGAPVADGS